jgi:hypothetical protein
LQNLLTERRLRNVQPLRGAAKVQFFRNGNKVAQMAQLNHHILNVSFEIINILYNLFSLSYSIQTFAELRMYCESLFPGCDA